MALGAYQSEQSRGNLLSALAHPQVVNPLAAQNQAYEVFGNQMRAREAIAQNALGQAYQQSTDPQTGQVNYDQFRRIAGGDPRTAMGIQYALGQAQALDTNQYDLHTARMSRGNDALGSLIGQYPNGIPQDAVNTAIDREVSTGLITPAQAQQLKGTFGADPRQNSMVATQLYFHNMNNQQQLDRMYGTRQAVAAGGSTEFPTVPPPAPGAPSVSVPHTMSPDTVGTQMIEWPATEADVKAGRAATLGQPVRMGGADIQRNLGQGGLLPPGAHIVTPPPGTGGVVSSDGTRASPANPPRLLNVPGSGGTANAPTPPATGNATPPPPGATGGTTAPYTGGGIGTVLNPQGQPQAPPAPNAAPPAAGGPAAVAQAKVQAARTGMEVPIPGGNGLVAKPNGMVGPPSGGPAPAPRADLGGGVPVAAGNAFTPSTGSAAPPSPAVAGDVGAILRGVANARNTPAAGPQVAATFAVGPGVQEPAEWKASADRLAADDTTAANFAQTQFPAVQALKELGRGTVTGPNADFINRIGGYIRTPLEKMGVDVGGLSDATQRYDALNKWLSQIVASTPFAAGSDARLAQVLNGSANTHINQGAAEDMLKAGITLQRMGVAANQQWHAMSPQEQSQYGGLYLNFLRGYANRVDPRAFGVDMYNDKQLADLRAAIKSGGEAAAKRFNDSKAIADGLSAQPAMP